MFWCKRCHVTLPSTDSADRYKVLLIDVACSKQNILYENSVRVRDNHFSEYRICMLILQWAGFTTNYVLDDIKMAHMVYLYALLLISYSNAAVASNSTQVWLLAMVSAFRWAWSVRTLVYLHLSSACYRTPCGSKLTKAPRYSVPLNRVENAHFGVTAGYA